jgi:hypothetical protein
MSLPPGWPQVLDFFGTSIVIEPSPGQLSGDAGLLPIRQFDQRIGLTWAFAVALDPDLTEHTFLEMVRSRVYGILAGYEDQNDHDTLRTDPSGHAARTRFTRYSTSPSAPSEAAAVPSRKLTITSQLGIERSPLDVPGRLKAPAGQSIVLPSEAVFIVMLISARLS